MARALLVVLIVFNFAFAGLAEIMTEGSVISKESSLAGKVLCGYQGWYRTPGDGSGSNWVHYVRGTGDSFEPGSCGIDYWPDVSESDPDERISTVFKHADGSTAQVYSSHNRKTVLRHFRWMREYGIDGVFVQRFMTDVTPIHPLWKTLRVSNNNILEWCRQGASENGRVYSVMYDLSGMPRTNGVEYLKKDWKDLVDSGKVPGKGKDADWLRHKGHPVVGLWGVGFRNDAMNSARHYGLDECAQLIDFFKHDPKYGGYAVLIGVPSYWRTLNRDSVSDPRLHEVMRKADIIQPWSVGRFNSSEGVRDFADKVWKGDLDWCRQNGLDYLPVTFPGFSWQNLKGTANQEIPRFGGKFLWAQYTELRKLGLNSAYQAMFDEMDEGTQIFKIDNNPPVGDSVFKTYEGFPQDHYLWLVGEAGRMLRGEISATPDIPIRVIKQRAETEQKGCQRP